MIPGGEVRLNSKRTNVILALVAVAIIASLYVIPTLAHPIWTDEPVDGVFEPGAYGPGPYGNETCPWYDYDGEEPVGPIGGFCGYGPRQGTSQSSGYRRGGSRGYRGRRGGC